MHLRTTLRRYDLTDQVPRRIAAIVHEADIASGCYNGPETPGIDIVVRGLAMIYSDDTLQLTGPVFNGLYENRHGAVLLGHEPSRV